MGLIVNQRTQIGIESSYNDGGASFTDVPVHIGAIPDFSPPVIEQPVYRGSMARNTTIVQGATYKLPIKFYAKGSGAAGTAPEIGKLLRAMGMQETVSAATSVTYKPRDTGFESVGLKHNLDGNQYWLKGAGIDNFKFVLKGKEAMLIEGDAMGLYNENTVVSIGTPTYADVAIVPPIIQSMALTVGGNTYIVPSVEFDCKNGLEEFESVNAGSLGIQSLEIARLRDWKFKIRVRRNTSNDVEFYTALTAGTEIALASTGFGSAGNKIAINANKIQFTKITPVDEKGMYYYDCDGNINYDATTEFSIVFT